MCWVCALALGPACSRAEPPAEPTPTPAVAPPTDGPRLRCTLRGYATQDDVRFELRVRNEGSEAAELSYFEPFATIALTADTRGEAIRVDQPAWDHPVRPATLTVPPDRDVPIATPISLRFDDGALDSSVPTRWLLRHARTPLHLEATLTFGDVVVGPCEDHVAVATPTLPYQTAELTVRARLRRAESTPAHCGVFHFAAAREYEVLEVLDGEHEGGRLYALESCPELGGPRGLGQVYRLALSNEAPTGLSIVDDLGDTDLRRFYTVAATPESTLGLGLGPADP